MKHIARIFAGLALLVLCQQARAGQWLTAVDLGTKQQIKAWHQAGLPANELIGNTAIAVLSDVQIRDAQLHGFTVNRLEQYDPQGNYLIAGFQNANDALPGPLLWQSSTVGLYRGEGPIKTDRHSMRVLSKTSLPKRFWKQAVTKIANLPVLPYDPYIQSLVDQVNGDSITATIQRLQAFRTRYIGTDSNAAAAQWLFAKYAAYGFTATFDTFPNVLQRPDHNVLAYHPGIGNPQCEVMVTGHYDDDDNVNPHDSCAPGADDNASGTAAAVEIARIMRGQTWPATLVCGAFGAEEQGLWGSAHHARWADSTGLDIIAMLNCDMIGYMNDSLQDCLARGTSWLIQLYHQAAQMYAPALQVDEGAGDSGSDETSFLNRGYSAMGCIETPTPGYSGGYPHYHQYSDSLVYLSPELFTGITKGCLATVLLLELHPMMVKDVAVHDMGNGTGLQARWTPSAAANITGYWVYWGRDSMALADSSLASGAMACGDTIDGLMTDSICYVVVRAVDDQGRLSITAEVGSGIPRTVPFTPSGLTASPITSGVRLDWHRNDAVDVVGYRLYRKVDDGSFDSLSFAGDTTYTDQPLATLIRYYYKIQAIDDDGNTSPLSDSVLGRSLTLDQGVLIVDETFNWSTGGYPRDTTQDRYYNYLLWDYRHTQYEYGSAGMRPVLSDFTPYSTVLWHGDDYGNLLAKADTVALRRYLDDGGKVLFAGWKPVRNLGGIGTDAAAYFSAGSLLHDYFKIDTAVVTPLDTINDFAGAIGTAGFPAISVDSAKVPLGGWRGCMRYIEALTPTAEGQAIYTMDMRNNASPYEGSICGIEYLGPAYKTALLGFPLYFMKQDQARALVAKIMTDFGEPYVGVTERPGSRMTSYELRLGQSRPNPFKQTTMIYYQLPKAGPVSLKIYNVAGQKVRMLVDGQQQPGDHAIFWDARDDARKPVASGIYMYQLVSGGSMLIRKMAMLR